MKIWLHKYELQSVDPRRKVRNGALLKVEWAAGQVGFGDLHPWPEFGEAPLEAHVESLRDVNPTALAKRALDFSYIDREFRLAKKNAFAGLVLPRSHRLVTDINAIDAQTLAEWHKAGFTHLKVKMGDDLGLETEALVQFAYATPLLWRLDFNGKLNAADFTEWWNALGPDVKARIDLIEDPTPGEELDVTGPWANDWQVQSKARIQIIKPARQTVGERSRYDRFVFTHSMDHPFGQACALYTAAKFYSEHPKKTDVCGLASPALGEGPRVKPPIGLGLGFDQLLSELEWGRLV